MKADWIPFRKYPNAMKTCRLVTLGCKVNQYETQLVKEALEANGYREVDAGQTADVCIVNTCTVTMEGDAKSRQQVRRLHQQNPAAAIVVMGCYATRAPEAVGRLPGVTQVITDKSKLAEELRHLGVDRFPSGIKRFDGHQRAFVKVQDGCLLNCTYCIIPRVRSTLRSRDPDEIVAEVVNLVENGVKEIVLTGVHLGHYGIDLCRGQPQSHWRRLWHLLEKLDALSGDFRIRLSSLEAAEARDDLVRVMRQTRRIVPHLHLCLQSGSDRILGHMKRRYRSAGFLARCRRLKEALDRPAFTTDVMVGFPGESNEDFAATCRVVREVGFCKLHIFSYSSREGTAAADFSDHVPPAVIAERRLRLLDIEKELAAVYGQSLVGSRLDVLVEGMDPNRPGHAVGTSCRYVPVSLPGFAPSLLGRRVSVRAMTWAGKGIVGEPIADSALPDCRIPESSRVALPLASIQSC